MAFPCFVAPAVTTLSSTPYAGMELTLYSKKVQERERELKKLEVMPIVA